MLKSFLDKRTFCRLFSIYSCRYTHNSSLDCISQQKELLDNTDCIKQFLSKNPKLNRDGVINIYRNFEMIALPLNVIPDLLKKCPELLKVPSNRLLDSLNGWVDCNFGEEALTQLFTTYPSVLYISRKHIEDKYSSLAAIFGHRSLFKLIFNSPLVLTEYSETTQSKVNYLEKEMKFSKNEIINTGSMNFTLEHIRSRFDFMMKAGVFKIPKPKTVMTDKQLNPHMKQILSLSDHDFSNKIVGVSLFEYRVFQEIMQLQEDSDWEEGTDVVIDSS